MKLMNPVDRMDNFHRMLAHDHPRRLPLHLMVTAPVAEMIEEHTGERDPVSAFDTDFRFVGVEIRHDAEAWQKAFAELGYKLPADASIGHFGITHRAPPRDSLGAAWHLREMEHPLACVTEAKQLSRLPWPGMDEPGRDGMLVERVREAHGEGRVVVGACACTCFEPAWYLRGMDYLLTDLMDQNRIADWLLDWFTHRSIACVRAMCRAGVDVIQLGDDIATQRGMMMSVPFWREHLRPRLKRVIDAVRACQQKPTPVYYHSDGDVRDVIEDLADIGVDILNPVQPECMPIDEVIAKHRNRIAFWGCIGTQSTMPFGSPSDVRQEIERLAAHARQGAAVIIAPTHVLEPDVPWENIVALADAVRTTNI